MKTTDPRKNMSDVKFQDTRDDTKTQDGLGEKNPISPQMDKSHQHPAPDVHKAAEIFRDEETGSD